MDILLIAPGKAPEKREIDGELASYRIAENVATMPHLSPALASTAGWKVKLVEGSLYLNAKTLGMTLIFR